jgi:hypothetical protein
MNSNYQAEERAGELEASGRAGEIRRIQRRTDAVFLLFIGAGLLACVLVLVAILRVR